MRTSFAKRLSAKPKNMMTNKVKKNVIDKSPGKKTNVDVLAT